MKKLFVFSVLFFFVLCYGVLAANTYLFCNAVAGETCPTSATSCSAAFGGTCNYPTCDCNILAVGNMTNITYVLKSLNITSAAGFISPMVSSPAGVADGVSGQKSFLGIIEYLGGIGGSGGWRTTAANKAAPGGNWSGGGGGGGGATVGSTQLGKIGGNFSGSGGNSYNGVVGGQGGGFLIFNIQKLFYFNAATLGANGASGSAGSGNTGGGGGGGGGHIIIFASNITFGSNADLRAFGGAGGNGGANGNGAGGGGGGTIHLIGGTISYLSSKPLNVSGGIRGTGFYNAATSGTDGVIDLLQIMNNGTFGVVTNTTGNVNLSFTVLGANSTYSCYLDSFNSSAYTGVVIANTTVSNNTVTNFLVTPTTYGNISWQVRCNSSLSQFTGASGNTSFVFTSPDTCTAPVVGDWSLSCSDNCRITGDQSVPANIKMTGNGVITLAAKWLFKATNQFIYIGSGCTLAVNSGGGIYKG